jgi:hypothetical protein
LYIHPLFLYSELLCFAVFATFLLGQIASCLIWCWVEGDMGCGLGKRGKEIGFAQLFFRDLAFTYCPVFSLR